MNVVIAGGGFCGTLVAKYLDNDHDIKTTLIDKKDFFEYSPGLHKVITRPGILKYMRVSYQSLLKNTTIITDTIKTITPKKITTESNRQFAFDYLVICTGIDYPIFLDNTENVYSLKRGRDAKAIANKIDSAESILIVGGGLIGTEIAGELVLKRPKKKITIVHLNDRLLERNKKKASFFAQKFLEKNGANIMFDEKITKHQNGELITENGKTINAGLTIWCAGIKANPSFMNAFPRNCFTSKNALNVNNNLQLNGFPNIFVGGDINSIKEEKTARKAKIHAKFISKNLKRMTQKKPLLNYTPRSSFQVISLGDFAGIIQYHTIVFNGFMIPGFFKVAAGLLTRIQMM